MHGWNGVRATWPWQETMHYEECIYTASCTASLQLLFSRFICFRIIASFFARPPSPVHIYSYVFTPGLYRIDMGVFLALGAMGPNMPLQATVWPTPSDEIAQPLLRLPSVCFVYIGPCAWSGCGERSINSIWSWQVLADILQATYLGKDFLSTKLGN